MMPVPRSFEMYPCAPSLIAPFDGRAVPCWISQQRFVIFVLMVLDCVPKCAVWQANFSHSLPVMIAHLVRLPTIYNVSCSFQSFFPLEWLPERGAHFTRDVLRKADAIAQATFVFGPSVAAVSEA